MEGPARRRHLTVRALVIGASGGIGAALTATLRQHGADVTGLSRSGDGLDVTDEASVAHHVGALSGPFDIILIATGALVIDDHQPEKTIRALSPDAMRRQFDLNTLGPAMVLKHAWPLVPREGRAVIGVLSARVGSIGDNALGGWYSYRTAKAAVNQIVHTAAIELRRSRPEAILVALHPGTVATGFTADYSDRYATATPAEAAANLLGVLDGLTPGDSGSFFDWKGERVPW